jgi:hypothetical protein
VRPTEKLPANRQPLNQEAKRRLQEAREPLRPDLPYLVQLLSLGFHRGLDIPGVGQKYRWELEQASGLLLDPQLNSVKVMRWFLNNPNGGRQAEQNDTLTLWLEEASDWSTAAQSLMEWFYARKAAQDPYYR